MQGIPGITLLIPARSSGQFVTGGDDDTGDDTGGDDTGDDDDTETQPGCRDHGNSVSSVTSVSTARDNEMRWPGQAGLPIRFVQYTDTMVSPVRAEAQTHVYSALGAARGEGDTVVYTHLSHNQDQATFNHKTIPSTSSINNPLSLSSESPLFVYIMARNCQ